MLRPASHGARLILLQGEGSSLHHYDLFESTQDKSNEESIADKTPTFDRQIHDYLLIMLYRHHLLGHPIIELTLQRVQLTNRGLIRLYLEYAHVNRLWRLIQLNFYNRDYL